MVDKVLFSTDPKSEWETPRQLFEELDSEFCFTLDVAASKYNRKCDSYFTKEDDALSQSWTGCCWCNPPYGRDVGKWIEKAINEVWSCRLGTKVVMLIPARTDTRWFHNLLWCKEAHQPRQGIEIRFLQGRLKFEDLFGDSKNSAPFPSMVVIIRKGR